MRETLMCPPLQSSVSINVLRVFTGFFLCRCSFTEWYREMDNGTADTVVGKIKALHFSSLFPFLRPFYLSLSLFLEIVRKDVEKSWEGLLVK